MKTNLEIMKEIAGKYPNGCSPEKFTNECMNLKAFQTADSVKNECIKKVSGLNKSAIYTIDINKFI